MFIMDFRHKKLSDVYLLMIHVSSRIVFERNSSPDTVTVVVRRETWDGSRRTKRPGDYLYHTTSVRKEIFISPLPATSFRSIGRTSLLEGVVVRLKFSCIPCSL
jgi:hypothetical protein